MGYIVFFKNDGDKSSESVDQAFFRWYHSKIALPFIASNCQHVFPDAGWQPGEDVPLGMEGVLLYDGGSTQLKAVSESEYLDEAAKCGVDGGKLNPNCTSVEQCLDIMSSFKILHAEMAKVNAEPGRQGNDNRCDTLWQSARACIEQQQKIRLAPGRLNLLLNAVSRVPEIWNKAFTPARMRVGWLKTGIVSADGSGPDLQKLRATRPQWTAEDIELCDKSFAEMVVDVANNGFVAEAKYDAFGFPKDTIWDGTVKERDVDTISNGGMARAAWTSHPAKREARKNYMLEISKQQDLKHNQLVDNVQSLLNYDKIATEKIRQAVITEAKNSHLQEKQHVEIFTEDEWWEGRIEVRDGNKSVTVSFAGPAATAEMNINIKANEWHSRLRLPEGDTRVQDVEADVNWMQNRVQPRHFDSLQTKDLRAFIRVRQASTLKDAPENRLRLPKQGKRDEPGGQSNLSTMAFNMRLSPVLMKLPSPAASLAQAKTVITPHLFQHSPAPNPEIPKASQYLNNPDWMRRIDQSFAGSPEVHTMQDVDVSRADALVPIILRRLERLVATRVPANKRKHWCLGWVFINSGVLAAIATRKGHVKRSNFLGDTSHICLLTQKLEFFHKVQGEFLLFEGCYLYVFSPDDDSENEDGVVMTRSGKSVSGVVGSKRNFGVRHPEHAKDALLDKKSVHSKFHLTYPSKHAPFRPTSMRGNFENLQQYVGIAWNPQDQNAVNAICDATANGIFVWPEEVLAYLRADKWNNMTMPQKQLNMVGYLLEIFYDLALSPCDNVSENPGFERYLLDFSRENVQ